jgi:hypothetical protein
MSTQNLTELPSIQYAGMDFNSVMSQLQEIIRNNPSWSENWTSFYSSEAGQMFLQLMSWICDNLSTRQDVLLNESFLSTANKAKNKRRLLKQIGYQPKLNHAAQAALTIELNSVSNSEVIITPDFSSTSSLAIRTNSISKISSEDKNGNLIVWEILPLSNNIPDYLGGVKLKAGSTTYNTDLEENKIFALQGETKYTEFISATSDGPYIDLLEDNISADSIAVYIKSNAKKCQQVNSFVSTEAISTDYALPYIVSLNDNGTLRIKFASKNTLDEKRLVPAGTTISVFYRVSNGFSGNIPAEFINTTAYFKNEAGETISAIVKNNAAAYNGADSEDLDSAVLNAPLTLRTLDRAVTVEDYDILLKQNPNILKIKTYTASNNPNDFYKLYGRYINPQEAFIFALVNHDYSSIPSSKYNDFPWISLYKTPRLNEKYSFSSGENNVQVSTSKTYYNLSLMESAEDIKKFSNATILDVGSNFNNEIANDLSNVAFQLKLATSKNEESYFNNISYSLLTKDENLGKLLVTDLIDHTEIKTSENARFISEASYQKEEEDSSIDAIDIANARYIIMSLDNRTTMVIDLFENVSEEHQPGEHYYVFWDYSTPKYNAEADDTSQAAAFGRHGIVQLINSQITAISNYDPNEPGDINLNSEAVDEYTSNNGYQWLGLRINSPNDDTVKTYDGQNFIFSDDNKRIDVNLTINGTTYKFPITPHERNTITYDQIVKQLNSHFNDCTYVKKLVNNEWETIDSTDKLQGLKAGIVQHLNEEDDYSGSYDIYIKGNSKWLNNFRINLSDWAIIEGLEDSSDLYNGIAFDGTTQGLVHFLHGADSAVSSDTLLGANLMAADYTNLATMLDDPADPENKAYFSIQSPIKGIESSIYFKTDETIEEGYGNFMRDYLGLYFNTQGTSQKAYGQKRIYIIKSSAEASYKEDTKSSESTSIEETLQIGNLIFENSCIYNNYDLASNGVFAFYKLTDTNSLEIGSVYDNFYYTGNSEKDEELKDKLVYLTGTAFDEFGNIDVINSNFEVKLTKNKVDTNSFYAIEDDLNLVPCDRVKISSANISEPFPNATLSFTFDSVNSSKIVHVDLSDLTNGPEVINAIKNAIKDFSGDEDDTYQKYIDNIDSVVYNSYDCLNQVVLRNLDKADGNITFYYNPLCLEENIKGVYKLFFGTSKTNSEFYRLYPRSLISEDNIIEISEDEYYYCPTLGKPLVFKYRNIVNGVSRSSDYYITYNKSSGKFLIVKTDESLFPTTSFYIHFVNDRSSLTDLECDEKTINEYMNDKKISGMELYLAKPYFKGYDIKATIYYNANYAESTIKNAVEEAIENLCSIKNAEIGGYMSQAKIIKEIMACNGVENVTINFFGYNYTDISEESKVQLEAKFYELLYINDNEDNKHGMIFDYEVQS